MQRGRPSRPPARHASRRGPRAWANLSGVPPPIVQPSACSTVRRIAAGELPPMSSPGRARPPGGGGTTRPSCQCCASSASWRSKAAPLVWRSAPLTA